MHHLIKYIIILALLIQSCKAKEPVQVQDKINLTGQIIGLADTSLVFSFESFKLLDSSKDIDIKVDDSGNFHLVLESQHPLKGFISFGKIPKTYKFDVTLVNGKDSSMQVPSVDYRMVYLYLSPGDSLDITVDPNNIQSTLSFSGKGAGNNLFVNEEEWKFNSYKKKYLNNYYQITYYTPDDYKLKKEEIRVEKKIFLRRFEKDFQLSTHLIELYDNQYDQDMIKSLIYYPAGNAGFNDGVNPNLPDNYYNFLDKAPIPESIDQRGITTYYYLNSLLRKKHELVTMGQSNPIDFYSFIEKELPKRLSYVFKAYALDRDFNKELYDVFGDSCPYPEIAELVKAKYSHLEGMLAGNLFPDFKLENTDGKIFTRDEFTGEFIYIDFWATWCKPCIKEIPHLEKLQEEFEDKPIKFVSISIDKEKDKDKWKKFVKENNLKGIQLWASEDQHDIFSKSLNIKSIPRFVLLDQEGKIISAQALRPSNPLLHELIKSLFE